MISLMYLFMAVVIILINFAALGLFLEPWFKDRNQARFWGFTLLALVLVFMGYTLGLAHVAMLWPLFTAGSAALLWSRRQEILSFCFWREDYVFFVVFLLVLAIRVVFPNIAPNSPQMGSLHQLASFYFADEFPPQDLWFASEYFQHQPGLMAAIFAVQGKLFSFGPGLAFNIAFASLFALMAGMLWSAARNLSIGYWQSAGAVAVLLLAGTGMAPLIWFLFEARPSLTAGVDSARQFWEHSMLLVGGLDQSSRLAASAETASMPMQSPAFYFVTGVFSTVLHGVFIATAMLSTYLHATKQEGRSCFTSPWLLVGLLVPVAYLTSGYALVFALLMAGLAIVRKPLPVLVGVLLGTLLCLPMMMSLSSGFSMPSLSLVTGPRALVQQLLLFWPLLLILVLLVAGLVSANHERSVLRTVLEAALVIVLLWLFTQLYFFDDLYGGRFERYSTSIHLWTLLYFVGFAWLWLLLAASNVRWQMLSAWVLAVPLVLANLLPMSMTLAQTDYRSLGKVRGHHAFTSDNSNADLLTYLQVARRGVMIESQGGGANTYTGRFSLFSGQPSLLAWPDEQRVWRANHVLINQLQEQLKLFYDAEMTPEQMLDFLQAHRVMHVLWQPEDVPVRSGNWQYIHDALLGHYQWVPFFDDGGVNKVGTFERLN